MRKKKYINKKTWNKLLKFLLLNRRVYVGKISNCKNFIEGVFWIMKTGAQWRELPQKYGCWNTSFKRFDSWSKKGIWEELFNSYSKNQDLEWVSIDSTTVRAHACSAGYGNQSREGLGRSCGGFSSKIHAKVDALGNLLKFIVSPGQHSDFAYAQALLDGTENSIVLGDKGYDSDQIRQQIKKQNCLAVIPGKNSRKIPIKYDKHLYKERNVVECFFSKIKHFRRVFSRFEKSVLNYKSAIFFVGTMLWLR